MTIRKAKTAGSRREPRLSRRGETKAEQRNGQRQWRLALATFQATPARFRRARFLLSNSIFTQFLQWKLFVSGPAGPRPTGDAPRGALNCTTTFRSPPWAAAPPPRG